MKKLTLLSALFIAFLFGKSQSTNLILSQESICAGESITAKVFAPEFSLLGTTGTNNQNGIMFDITADLGCVIKDFTVDVLAANTTIEVYYKTGTHVGFETNAASWTLVESVSGVASGLRKLGLNLNIEMVPGQTMGFYLTTTGGVNISYATGSSVGNIINQDTYIAIKEGTGKAYPFGASFMNRSFVGTVHYSPKINSVTWNTGQVTNTDSIEFTPTKSSIYRAALNVTGGLTYNSPQRAVIVNEVNAKITANPAEIEPGQSSTLTGSFTYHSGLISTIEGGNNQNGAMFDIKATEDIVLEGFTVNMFEGGTADIEVLSKNGSHVGFETNASNWTSIKTISNLPGGFGRFIELDPPIQISKNDTMSFYITRTDAGQMYYSNGTSVGTIAASDEGIQILEGVGVSYPFGNVFSTRVLNTIVHYSIQNPSGATFSWAHGGSGGNVVVSPSSTTSYSLAISKGGCTSQTNIEVEVLELGSVQDFNESLTIYPNPASNFIYIKTPYLNQRVELEMKDIIGKTIVKEPFISENGLIELPLANLTQGIYMLTIRSNDKTTLHKVQILK